MQVLGMCGGVAQGCMLGGDIGVHLVGIGIDWEGCTTVPSQIRGIESRDGERW